MPTFIDESGDTGFTKNGGKPYFRLAAVWVPSLDQAEAFRQAIRQLRRDLGLRVDYEFKFYNTHKHPEQRRNFLTAALLQPFRFTVCSLDKTAAYWNTAIGAEQQWACATTLAVHLRAVYHRSEQEKGVPLREPVIVDSNSDGNYLNIVKQAFRGLQSKGRPGSSLVGKVRFRKSEPDEMLHLADMVCGAVGSHLDGEDSAWYQMIIERDLGVVCLP
ncbi:MAG TPA: DUF3800 domain-containing protein [Gemmataceae bacterium]|nr:DUF3800 domain-containing protein [Gemmataceae bacterium]